ncbi:MAG: ABC transporter ATP-binding protein [Chloroflexota bacterium]|nr:ABC transporter ATP-binding protein [Chloroflexota bacterium]
MTMVATTTRPPAAATGQGIVSLRGLRVRYGATEAVRGIDLDIYEGETFGLLGPNGAGKTTTLSCIEGLRRPDGGTVRVFGEDMWGGAAADAAVKARIGVSLQSTALFPLLTILELLELYAAMYGRFPGRTGLRGLLDRFGLADKANARAGELSGGQQQRLALVIALINDPTLVILDEPTAGLDPAARRAVWDLLTDLRAEGRTILLTTHAMEEAEALCGRVGIIDRGGILALDSPAALVRRLGDRATVLATVELPLEPVRTLPGALTARYAGERLEVASDDAEATAGALRALARDRGRPLRDMMIRRPNLEDVFIALTGRTIAG